MTDPFLAFLYDLKATYEAERDKKYDGLPQEFVKQNRLIAAACAGTMQTVIAKHQELNAPQKRDDRRRRRVWSRARDFAASLMNEISVKQGEVEARLIVHYLDARGVAAVAEQRKGKWLVRKEGEAR